MSIGHHPAGTRQVRPPCPGDHSCSGCSPRDSRDSAPRTRVYSDRSWAPPHGPGTYRGPGPQEGWDPPGPGRQGGRSRLERDPACGHFAVTDSDGHRPPQAWPGPTHPRTLPHSREQERVRQATRPADVCVNAGCADSCEHACTKPADTGRWTCTPRTEPRTHAYDRPRAAHGAHVAVRRDGRRNPRRCSRGPVPGRHRKDTHGTGQAHGTRSPSQ